MSYSLNLDGFEGQKIEAKTSIWTTPKLTVNGLPPQKGARRGEMILQRNDGRQVVASWRPKLILFDAPDLVVDGKAINLVAPLKWYQWVWGALPILLIFWGGAIGAIVGIIAFAINTNLFRSKLNGILKYVVTGLVTIIAAIVYLVVGSVVYTLING